MSYRIVEDKGRYYLRSGNKNIESLGKVDEVTDEQKQKVLDKWNKEYDIIYADPPWQYDFSKSDSRAIETHYQTMSLENICKLKIPAKEDSVLFLWATTPKLLEALQVMKAWGFIYKTNLVWVKNKIGMGYYARGRHELLLIGAKGKSIVPAAANRQDSVLTGERLEHSRKPESAYLLIELAYPNKKKLELFARKTRMGWESWGNEI